MKNMSLDIYKDSSFLKVLLEPNSSELLMPNEFVRKYGEMLPREAYLMTEEVFGRCWRVKISRLENGGLCFGSGWPEFVKDNRQICASDVAIIKLVDASTFHVSIFGEDGVKKQSSSTVASTPHPQDAKNKKRRGKRPVVDCSSSRHLPSIPQGGGNPIDCTESCVGEGGEMKSFTIVLAAHHLYSLDIPTEFGVQTGIANIRSIMLENEKGDSWEVKVLTRKRDGRIWLRSEDWKRYWEGNGLVIGNELTLSIIGHDFRTLHVGSSAPKKKRGRTIEQRF